MGEILRNWIQARLGILIDLTPDVFGHYTRDGTLLAQILHSYDIINHSQLETIIHTTDPALCRVNLKHLRLWLRFVGVEFDDEGIDEISCGKGTRSLRLFYKLYLCLETKDRLHLITLQKEREKYGPTSKKFEVTRVSEHSPPYQPRDHPLGKKLAKEGGIVGRSTSGIPLILTKIRRERQGLECPDAHPEQAETARCQPEKRRTALDSRVQESKELDRFAYERRVRRKLSANDDVVVEDSGGNPKETETYVEWLKNRKKRTATATVHGTRMQRTLMSMLWERVAEKQERAFDEAIAGRTLDQSKHERQIVTKLCEVREQKSVMAENQTIVEDISLETKKAENRASYELEKNAASRKQRDVETECRRMCELRKRLLATKVQRIRNKHQAICRRIVEDLAIIASNVADHRRVNDGRVPLSLLAEWRSLFLKGRTIFVEEIPYGVQRQDSLEDEQEWFLKSDACADSQKVEAHRDALFDDYLETRPPWDESLPTLDEEARETLLLGHLVVGYIVHRLLGGLYARPFNRPQSLLAKTGNVAIVLGIGNLGAHESIRALLDKSGIRAIRMEDAINYCLERYKEEMLDVEYIDSKMVTTTAEIVRELGRGIQRASNASSSKDRSRGSRSVDEVSASPRSPEREAKGSGKGRQGERKRKTLTGPTEKESNNRDRETQTPRNIPYDDMDPVLSDAACMGKRAYEFLALGEPISNELATKILMEYSKSLANATGLVLIDYPGTYEQMSLLETTLTGTTPPPDPRAPSLEAVSIEDIEDVVPRIVFEDETDPLASNRQSKLVPNPAATLDEAATSGRPFAAMFVRVKQQPRNFERGNETYEAIAEDAPSIDRFYASHGIARIFYYATLDLPTLKMLARLVIGDPLQRKSSDELFGDALAGFQRDGRRGPSTKEAVARHLLTQDRLLELEADRDSVNEETRQELASDDFPLEIESRPAKPGERSWRWIDLPLPSALLECLAGIWEGMEGIYVQELKELLFLKSVHASSVGSYTDFIARNAREFAERPDTKQNLLREFHEAFNAIDLDARNDSDVKCELHRRVFDFQTKLWQICDERRLAAEEERKRCIDDQWTVREAVLLFNVYVGLIQAEMDRYVGTMRVLQDYYLGMLKRPLPEVGVSRVALNKMETMWMLSAELKEEDSSELESTHRKKGEQAKASSSAPAAIELADLRREINEALTDRDVSLESGETVCLLKGILDNVRYARSVVDVAAASAADLLKREQLAVPRGKDLATDLDPAAASRGQDLALEWQYAIAYEVERVRFKLESITGVARVDVAFLLETMQRTFHGIHDSVLARYWREMKSANDAANVFCFAIEEGTVLEKEMLLDGDRFVIRSNACLTEAKASEATSPKEIPSPIRFRVAHLVRLMEIFKRVAPHGTLSERALVYILQDLASHGQEEGETIALPCSWYRLRQSDVSCLVARLFERTDYVDWREFLVYAMDLPIPTCRDILIARNRFLMQDPGRRETVTLAQFHRTPLWFPECEDTCVAAHRLLLDEFQRNRDELYEEELCLLDEERQASVLSTRGSVSNATGCCAKETLRWALAKRMLCRMYAIDRQSVNYTALLLAFCKDEDPRKGFGKALALALGNRVCTDTEDGERYVEELVRRKERPSHRSVVQELARSMVDRLMHRVEERAGEGETTPEDSTDRTEDMIAFKHFDEYLDTDSFARIDSLDSGAIEGGEVSRDSSWDRLTRERETVVYWISLDLCLTVLAAALPWHALRPELIGMRSSLREGLVPVFQELRDPELNEQRNIALAHRLLNHDFMKRLLTGISKFTAKSMGGMVLEILRARDNGKSD